MTKINKNLVFLFVLPKRGQVINFSDHNKAQSSAFLREKKTQIHVFSYNWHIITTFLLKGVHTLTGSVFFSEIRW